MSHTTLMSGPYTLSQKTCHPLVTIISSNLNRFSKFSHSVFYLIEANAYSEKTSQPAGRVWNLTSF